MTARDDLDELREILYVMACQICAAADSSEKVTP